MDQPLFRKNAQGQIEEYRPVVVDPAELKTELDQANKEKDQIDKTVIALEKRRTELEDELEKNDDTLKVVYADQEAAAEKATFCKSKLDAFNKALSADPAPVDGASSPAAQDMAPSPTPGQPTSEDVAESLDLGSEDATTEPEAPTSEEVEVTVRRRASV